MIHTDSAKLNVTYRNAPKGYADLLGLARIGDVAYDPWGEAMSWAFAIADVVLLIDGEILPGYRPSPMGPETTDGVPDSSNARVVWEMYWEGHVTRADLDRAYAVAGKCADIARAHGRDY